MRKRFNEELLAILEEEQRKENDREEVLRSINDPELYNEKEKQFGVERAVASRRIIEVSQQHETIILREMKRLGIIV